MRLPLTRWPGHSLSVPLGLALSLHPDQAPARNRPYRARSPLARALRAFLAAQGPDRPIRRLAAGGDATKDEARPWPDAAHVVGRVPIRGKRSTLPPTPTQQRRGAPRKQGARLGSPQTRGPTSPGWAPPPSAAGAALHAGWGLWHAVLPGRLVRAVVLRRARQRAPQRPGPSTPPPAMAACCTTDLTWSAQDSVHESSDRWAVAMTMRDANACAGLGQDPCRQRPRLIGANTFRVGMAAARTLWFIDHVACGTTFKLCCYRPWYQQKVAPRQLDVVWVCRAALHEAGIFPIPRFTPALAEKHEEPAHALPLAA